MIITVIGARPQFIKAAVLSKAFANNGIKEIIIHTGQHYDPKMSNVFFDELGLNGISTNLHIGSGDHGNQTGRMMIAIENYLLDIKHQIKAVLVYGDTNSTLAGALVASKMHIPVIHVEAGLRSFNKEMPEEINRILTDHISDLLFCSSDEGYKQLLKEGIVNNVHLVGDIMLDAVKTFLPFAKMPNDINIASILSEKYNLITIHRPANTDNLNILQNILDQINQIKDPCIWPIHPRNNSSIAKLHTPKNLTICEPFSYLEMLYVLNNCAKVITDSGGLQKEAYWLKKPCITVRPQTEWIETLHDNWNQLSDPSAIYTAYLQNPIMESWVPLYGEGHTSGKIINIINNYL